MSKKKEKKNKKRQAEAQAGAPVASDESAPEAAAEPKAQSKATMSRKEFEREMEKLQVELVKMQEWVKASGAKICVLFEGPRRRRQGRHHQAHHRTHQPTRLPRGGAGNPDRAGEVADVLPALHAPSARSR